MEVSPPPVLIFLLVSFLVCLFVYNLELGGCKSLDFLEHPKIKSDTVSTVSPSISHEVMGPEAMILVFLNFEFKPAFSLSSFTFITGALWLLFNFCQ